MPCLRNVCFGGRILGLIKSANHGWLSMMTPSEGPLFGLASGPPNLKPTTSFTQCFYEYASFATKCIFTRSKEVYINTIVWRRCISTAHAVLDSCVASCCDAKEKMLSVVFRTLLPLSQLATEADILRVYVWSFVVVWCKIWSVLAQMRKYTMMLRRMRKYTMMLFWLLQCHCRLRKCEPHVILLAPDLLPHWALQRQNSSLCSNGFAAHTRKVSIAMYADVLFYKSAKSACCHRVPTHLSVKNVHESRRFASNQSLSTTEHNNMQVLTFRCGQWVNILCSHLC